MTHSLPVPHVACTLCPVGAASRVGEGQCCPMVDRRRAAESYLYLRGTPADTVYYLKHGAVALIRGSGDDPGNGAPYAIRRAGAFLGLETIVRPTYLESARAVSDVTVCAMGRSQALAWLDRTGTARVVLETLIETLAHDTTPRARTEGSARTRVARWLREPSTQKRLPRTVLAGLLGMSPETLSRALASLARAGTIELTRSRIAVRDMSKLEAISECNEDDSL